MSKKEKPNVQKPKEFSVSGILLSELSFVDQQKRAALEVHGFWGYRVEETQNRIKESLGLKPLDEWAVDFGRIYSTGKVFALKVGKPKVETETPPEAKVEVVENKNGESKLQEKQN